MCGKTLKYTADDFPAAGLTFFCADNSGVWVTLTDVDARRAVWLKAMEIMPPTKDDIRLFMSGKEDGGFIPHPSVRPSTTYDEVGPEFGPLWIWLWDSLTAASEFDQPDHRSLINPLGSRQVQPKRASRMKPTLTRRS